MRDTNQIKVGVVGAGGFLGSRIMALGGSTEHAVEPVAIPRVNATPSPDPFATFLSWRRNHPADYRSLCDAFDRFDVIVNAAGLAAPLALNQSALYASNVLLPVLVALASRQAGVRRLVHLSSASVQGRLDPLDETDYVCPLSPYATSKALAETYLLAPPFATTYLPPEVVVYRPTSVMDAGHGPTQALTDILSRLPCVPVSGRGDRPVPVGLCANVASAALFCATVDQIAPLVLHPNEGITSKRLLELFGARRFLPLPPHISTHSLSFAAKLTSRMPRVTARLRWIELVLHGQAVAAHELYQRGFVLPYGHDAWAELGARQVLSQRTS